MSSDHFRYLRTIWPPVLGAESIMPPCTSGETHSVDDMAVTAHARAFLAVLALPIIVIFVARHPAGGAELTTLAGALTAAAHGSRLSYRRVRRC
ncbi:hypothetical protein [Streptomyces vinaceus]|uniref:hypothetical protein n=1 Tax=Streptomyces vinaceus TaxID=1960 RepID=UPI0036BC2191